MDKSLDILIVDDDRAILNVVTLVLKSHGHKPLASHAEDTACVLELKKGNYLPDIILLDILLSGTDGRDLCRQLKNNPKTKHIPIIMFSAYPDARDTAMQAGASAFLSKPFSWRDLDSAIKEARRGMDARS